MPQRQFTPEEKKKDQELMQRALARQKQEEEFEEEATLEWLAPALGWDKPGQEGMEAMFESPKSAAGPRGATFLGRPIKPRDTLQDVLKRIPAAELEEAGGAIKAVKMPEIIKGYGGLSPGDLLPRLLGVDPFLFQPVGIIKYMRRKLEQYVDPEEQGPIEHRPERGTRLNIAAMLGDAIRENLNRKDSPLVRKD